MNALARQIIRPRDDAHWHALRANDITSTDVAALFGLSPYKTHFELWYEKKQLDESQFRENARVTWGKRLEAVIAQGIAEDNGFSFRPMPEYIRLEGLRLGSSFDFRVLSEGPHAGMITSSAFDRLSDAHFEIKNVDWLRFRDTWIIDGDFIEAPAHIELQVQHQMLVSGLRRAYIGVMVGGNDIRVIEREADEPTQRAILSAAKAFWASIDSNTPPKPVMPDDAAAVIRLNSFAEPGKLLDGRHDAELVEMIARYSALGRDVAKLQDEREVVKAELLERIGDHEKVLLDGFTVSAGMVAPTTVETYVRKGYRNFRVTAKKANPS